jgi:diguanylate cyclase (GGDEF)-like protein/PAS domain S-box-containing protein
MRIKAGVILLFLILVLVSLAVIDIIACKNEREVDKEDPDLSFQQVACKITCTINKNRLTIILSLVIMFLFARELTRRKQAEEALRVSEERYALSARGANDGLWDWNLVTNEIYFSPRWKSMLGYKENEIQDSTDEWFNRVHLQDREQVKEKIKAHVEGHTPHFESEHRILHKDGTYRWVLSRGLAVRDTNGKAYRMAGSQTDITNYKVAEEQLLHDVYHDTLTGLPNRAFFKDQLIRAIGQAKRRKRRQESYLFAVLFLGLDRFKIINDSLGHVIGDQLLITVARRLKTFLRAGDMVARLGGDEFTILLDDIKDMSDAIHVADRIQKGLVTPFNLSGHDVVTTASIGIALSTTGYEQPEDVLRDAGIAMYRAKTHGKARCEVFDKSMHSRAMERMQLEADLRRALERQEFLLHYQPIVGLESGKIIGSEALIRWQHPQRGFISPAEFIPLAEETGLIVPIGEWVLRTACKQSKTWQEAGLPSLWMAINLSSRQFKQQNLAEKVSQILSEAGVAPSLLELELTESMIMEKAETTILTLKALKQTGIKLSIDDFGTGYSSLSYLKRFPLDKLKVDQSFVRDITTDPDDAIITAVVSTLAHGLKLRVIAEGVETREQLTFLRSQHYDEVQGYLFSRPIPAEEFTDLLIEYREIVKFFDASELKINVPVTRHSA